MSNDITECLICNQPQEVVDREAYETLAKIVSQEFSGIHYLHVTPDAVDYDIAAIALTFIKMKVTASQNALDGQTKKFIKGLDFGDSKETE